MLVARLNFFKVGIVYYSVLRVRYTPLSTKEDRETPHQNGSLAGTQTLVKDDADLVDANGSATGHPAAVISYHDDSDDVSRFCFFLCHYSIYVTTFNAIITLLANVPMLK